MPGLNKVARKLNVDCAAAMVGWDFHGGFNHPVYVHTVDNLLPFHFIFMVVYVQFNGVINQTLLVWSQDWQI